ncbi:sugar phosphate isomerase/epimerase family protein [Planctomonas psychrotolerans]|uniref:sugar phosphate isomerase/epimerase family protein n=1 Tax=Planctomonas psychrotolerans TaxID=2528712 RepID=UPI0012390BFE|nr:sugar phosphate isomerase/epimerase family protein [Planctomonas psychrotolerans]
MAFNIGFSTLACPDYDLDGIISLATRSGYTGIELRFVRGEVDLPTLEEFSPARLAETRARFTDAGLSVVCVDTSVRQSSLDESAREAERANARANVRIAAGLGAPFIRVFGGPIAPEDDRERVLDAIAAGLGAVAEESAAEGVTTLLESHDDFSTSESILDLFARGAGDALQVLWDTLHTYRHGESPDYTWSKLGDRIRHVHMKDSNAANADGFDFALAGEGTVPLLDILGVLQRNGYAGFVHFEWEKAWHPEIEDAEIAVPHFARYLADAM